MQHFAPPLTTFPSTTASSPLQTGGGGVVTTRAVAFTLQDYGDEEITCAISDDTTHVASGGEKTCIKPSFES